MVTCREDEQFAEYYALFSFFFSFSYLWLFIAVFRVFESRVLNSKVSYKFKSSWFSEFWGNLLCGLFVFSESTNATPLAMLFLVFQSLSSQDLSVYWLRGCVVGKSLNCLLIYFILIASLLINSLCVLLYFVFFRFETNDLTSFMVYFMETRR